ncbi:MAG: alpha/beta fold hydrolase [Paracoccaceae bacterium]|nr:alpha/beta fold hydrolase [Paracoccaceae bacterium]
MSGVLTLPRLGETMEEGRVVAWLVAAGAAFKRGDVLLEVETDKTVVEVPALSDGVIMEILAEDGARVGVGEPIARLEGEGAAAEGPVATPPEPASTTPYALPAGPAGAASATGRRVRATPLARRIARASGLDIAGIPGTGRRGRVERRDVEAALAASDDAASPSDGLAYEVAGPERGEPAVLIHGFGADRAIWGGLTADLARSGRRVLAVDLPGHGESTPEAADIAALSEGLAALVGEAMPEGAHIVAHSLGAVPALALAEAWLARSLTLIAPAGVGYRIDAAFVHGLAGAETAGEVAHLLARTTTGPVPLSDGALEDIAQGLARRRLLGLASDLVDGGGQRLSIRAALARLAETLPVRVVVPGADRILDPADMAAISPRVAVHHLPNAGHMAFWDAPEMVRDIVLAETSS